jgi:hypothetical protein
MEGGEEEMIVEMKVLGINIILSSLMILVNIQAAMKFKMPISLNTSTRTTACSS